MLPTFFETATQFSKAAVPGLPTSLPTAKTAHNVRERGLAHEVDSIRYAVHCPAKGGPTASNTFWKTDVVHGFVRRAAQLRSKAPGLSQRLPEPFEQLVPQSRGGRTLRNTLTRVGAIALCSYLSLVCIATNIVPATDWTCAPTFSAPGKESQHHGITKQVANQGGSCHLTSDAWGSAGHWQYEGDDDPP